MLWRNWTNLLSGVLILWIGCYAAYIGGILPVLLVVLGAYTLVTCLVEPRNVWTWLSALLGACVVVATLFLSANPWLVVPLGTLIFLFSFGLEDSIRPC